MKGILLVLLCTIGAFTMVGCGNGGETTATTEITTIAEETAATVDAESIPSKRFNVGALKGPTGIGIANLMDKGTHNVSLYGAADELIGKFTSGEIDIAMLPTNVASMLYNKMNGNVRIAAVNTLGVLYVLSSEEIDKVADLAGKTIYATSQGAVPEYVFNYILEENGIKDSVNVEYKSEHAELATLMIAGEVNLGLLPVPFATNVTMKNEAQKIVIDLTKEWEAVTDGKALPMGVVAIKADFIEENKAEFDTFLAEYNLSAAEAIANIEKTAELCEKYEIMTKAVAVNAIPYASIVCITGDEMQEVVSGFLEIIAGSDAKSVGGTLPNEDIYYKQ